MTTQSRTIVTLIGSTPDSDSQSAADQQRQTIPVARYPVLYRVAGVLLAAAVLVLSLAIALPLLIVVIALVAITFIALFIRRLLGSRGPVYIQESEASDDTQRQNVRVIDPQSREDA